MIVRVAEHPRYAVIDQRTIRDDRLSFRARGVLMWLLDRPANWSARSEAIAHHGKEGRDAIRAALKELESYGYLVRTREQDEAGHWVTVSVVYELPPTKEQVTPKTDFQSSEVQSSESQALKRSTEKNY